MLTYIKEVLLRIKRIAFNFQTKKITIYFEKTKPSIFVEVSIHKSRRVALCYTPTRPQINYVVESGSRPPFSHSIYYTCLTQQSTYNSYYMSLVGPYTPIPIDVRRSANKKRTKGTTDGDNGFDDYNREHVFNNDR